MQQYMLAFITGLTTGGLSCLAVQGGLLATSMEQQIQETMIQKGKQAKNKARHRLALPIILFLTAKLVAYTMMGFLLGALGSVLQLSTTMRAILLIAIGIFMVGNALRMLNVHPIFRYFAIEPPKFITRTIRKVSKGGDAYATPITLGFMTVFIPCGVTQAMMAVALATGDPIQGAMIMFAFTLGTIPVFFGVAYLATQLGSLMEKWFMRFVAIVVLIVGIMSIDSGLTLMGNRYSIASAVQSAFVSDSASPETLPGSSVTPTQADGTMTLEARNNGYFPRSLVAKAGEALTLNVVTDNTHSCAVGFTIPDLDVQVLLPATGTTPIEIPPQEAGKAMLISCSMGMYTSVIEFK